MEEHVPAEAEAASATTLILTPEFERAVLERVASGAYASTDEVLTACLQALTTQEDVLNDLDVIHRELGLQLRRQRAPAGGEKPRRSRKPPAE